MTDYWRDIELGEAKIVGDRFIANRKWETYTEANLNYGFARIHSEYSFPSQRKVELVPPVDNFSRIDESAMIDECKLKAKTYIQIKDCDGGPIMTLVPEEAKKVIDGMVNSLYESGSEDKYSFEAVEMTEQEFKDLPEFTGL